jgi:hypothetical protein
MPTIKLKSQSGQICDVRCEQIYEIDGVPYAPARSDMADRVAHLEGQVGALFELFTQPAEAACEVPIDDAGDSVVAVTSTGV